MNAIVLRARGETKPRALAWKTLLSAAVFAAALVGVSGIINNVIHGGSGARMAAAVAVPLNDCHEPDDEVNWLRGDFFYEARKKGWMVGEDYGY